MTRTLDDDDLGALLLQASWLSEAGSRGTAADIESIVAELRERRAADVLTEGDLAAFCWSLTGEHVSLFAPKPEQFHIVDIARGLATHFRYNGHTRQPYSVAEHSVIVSLYVPPEYARQALLHDAAEAYIGDMSRPMKHRPSLRGFREIEARIEAAIYIRFGVEITNASNTAVKRIDDRILVDEIGQLISTGPGELERVRKKLGPALGATIGCLHWAHAEYVFLDRFLELFPGVETPRRNKRSWPRVVKS